MDKPVSGGAKLNALRESLGQGHYFKKQVLCSDRLISWSHRRRLTTGIHLASQFAGQRILDFGCGDGTFLALLMEGPHAPAAVVGSEEFETLVEDCSKRLGNGMNARFILSRELGKPEHQHAYDGIICMEVLEHVPDVAVVLDAFLGLLAPSGKLIVSVPVETGPPLIVKQAVRTLAGWKKVADYPGVTPYTFKELLKGLVAGRKQHIVRPIHRTGSGAFFHDHKGFNWMVVQDAVSQRFRIENILSSPVPWLPPYLASQVWFVAVKEA